MENITIIEFHGIAFFLARNTEAECGGIFTENPAYTLSGT